MSEANKAITRRWMEMFNEGNLTIADEILAGDFLYHDPTVADIRGLETFKAAVDAFRKALAGLFTMDDLIAEGDKVAFRFTFTGIHTGQWAGVAPTGKPFCVQGAGTLHFANGRIREGWADWDVYGLWRQVGATTDPAVLAAR